MRAGRQPVGRLLQQLEELRDPPALQLVAARGAQARRRLLREQPQCVQLALAEVVLGAGDDREDADQLVACDHRRADGAPVGADTVPGQQLDQLRLPRRRRPAGQAFRNAEGTLGIGLGTHGVGEGEDVGVVEQMHRAAGAADQQQGAVEQLVDDIAQGQHRVQRARGFEHGRVVVELLREDQVALALDRDQPGQASQVQLLLHRVGDEAGDEQEDRDARVGLRQGSVRRAGAGHQDEGGRGAADHDGHRAQQLGLAPPHVLPGRDQVLAQARPLRLVADRGVVVSRFGHGGSSSGRRWECCP